MRNERGSANGMKLALPLLRTLVGGLFIGHGTQKLFGLFGGGGTITGTDMPIPPTRPASFAKTSSLDLEPAPSSWRRAAGPRRAGRASPEG